MDFTIQPNTSEGARLFAYGTLRKGFRSHKLLQDCHARFLGTGRARGRLYDLGEYPGATESVSETDRICGEVYWLPRASCAFGILDRYEGFNPARTESSEFVRKETTVILAGGRKVRAWVYWLLQARTSGRRLFSGDYAVRRIQ